MALALGGNLPGSRAALLDAIAHLASVLDPLATAPLYRTRALSPLTQPPFLNTVVLGRTRLDAEQLLGLCKALEWRAGRRRGRRHGPRLLDIDLLLFGRLTSARPELTLPHPGLRRRRFVLAPLCDLDPAFELPPDAAPAAELLAGVGQEDDVERVDWDGVETGEEAFGAGDG